MAELIWHIEGVLPIVEAGVKGKEGAEERGSRREGEGRWIRMRARTHTRKRERLRGEGGREEETNVHREGLSRGTQRASRY